ncbi:MAG: hypothetical protein ACRCZF_18650, partial [Gemmataceae bacterium]
VNANGKFLVKTIGGQKALMKLNTNSNALVAKANTYITLPGSTDYIIQCDVMGTVVRGKMPDVGIINSRYNLLLDGKDDPDTKKRSLRLTSWDARPRVNIGQVLQWEPGTWYTLKLAIQHKETTAVVRGKVWKKGEAEPDKWSIEFEDPLPNREGAAGLYGYISNIKDTEAGSEAYYDNLEITRAPSR